MGPFLWGELVRELVRGYQSGTNFDFRRVASHSQGTVLHTPEALLLLMSH